MADGLNISEVGVRGSDSMGISSGVCIRSRSRELSEGSEPDASGFVRKEVLRRRTGPGPDASKSSQNSSAGSCERSAMSHEFSCSGLDSIAEIHGNWSKAMAAPDVSKRQSARAQ